MVDRLNQAKFFKSLDKVLKCHILKDKPAFAVPKSDGWFT